MKLFLFVLFALMFLAFVSSDAYGKCGGGSGLFQRAYARKADRHQRIADRHAARASCSAACANAPARPSSSASLAQSARCLR